MESNNGINNYKGVMLCSRPNQNPAIQKQKPFCARVVPPDHLGLVPTKKYDQIKVKKKKNPVLDGHKRWLQQFKKKVTDKKQNQIDQQIKKQQRLQKIKQQGYKQRQKALNKSFNSQTQVKQDQAKFQNKTRRRDDQKPAWAQTQQQIQKKQEKQVDDLIDFFNNTDIEKYIDQVQITALMKTLKDKIQQIKKQQNWKQKEINRYKQKKMLQNKVQQDDKKTNASKNSVGKSIASERTSQRIQQLKQKKQAQQKQWDKHTKTSKHSYVNIEQKIAKNVADDIIRNYGNIKNIHSNQSVRKILERQAARQLGQNNNTQNKIQA